MGACHIHGSEPRETDLEEGFKPGGLERIFVGPQVLDYLCGVGGDIPGKKEPIV
jgi:hypothetical protein